MLLVKKTNPTTELWQVAQQWLKSLGHNPNTKFCKVEIGTHPDYPALTAITDFLHNGGIQYVAAQADATYYNQFNYPLLAHFKQTGYEYLQPINSIEDWQTKDTTKWSGIVLFAEKNTSWQNEENNTHNKNAAANKFTIAILSSIALSIFIWLAIKNFNVTNFSFGLLSLIGIVISIFAMGVELGYQNQLVKQVCGAVSGGGCQAVVKSKFAKGVLGITPADASVVYFATQFLLFLLGTFYTTYFYAIAQLSLLGIVITVWSIYTQAIKIKQWCALCLGIVVVLLGQFCITVFTINTNFYGKNYLVFIVLAFIIYAILYPLKQLLKTNTLNQQKLAELKKWKTDVTLFTALWQQQPQVDTSMWDNDLLIGNPQAPQLITVACNPYCGPCAIAHKKLDELLKKYPNKIKLQVRLLCNPKIENDKLTIAVKNLLQKAATIENNNQLEEMLNDWFEWMNVEKWKTKWIVNEQINVDASVEQHTNWMTEVGVKFTPTFYLNGRQLPNRYNLGDLEMLLQQL
jgi:protein-disulfide isomerase/uncharacterized membrane protein